MKPPANRPSINRLSTNSLSERKTPCLENLRPNGGKLSASLNFRLNEDLIDSPGATRCSQQIYPQIPPRIREKRKGKLFPHAPEPDIVVAVARFVPVTVRCADVPRIVVPRTATERSGPVPVDPVCQKKVRRAAPPPGSRHRRSPASRLKGKGKRKKC